VVDIKASATFRFTISEAFARFEVPAGAPAVDLVVASNLDPLRFSAVLEFELGQERTTLVLGSPLLPGESTVWNDSDGTIATSSLLLAPGSVYAVYSRLASYGEVNHGLSLSFSAVPEPGTGLMAAMGLVALLAGRRRARPRG
jgi:MYXO-CTERM domain-containing protein